MPTIICRVAFCPKCYVRKSPQRAQHILLYCTNRNIFSVHEANKWGVPGYTPHVIEICKTIDSAVHFKMFCGVHGCGCLIWENTDVTLGRYSYKITAVEYGIVPINHWNAWMLYKRDPDYHV